MADELKRLGGDKHGDRSRDRSKSMPGNTAQMGYDDLGQMTSRKVTLTATPFRPNRSLFPMTVARALKKRDRSDKRGK